MTKLKRFWPYALLILALLAGGMWYLRSSDAKVPILSTTFHLNDDEADDKDTTPKEVVLKNYGPAPEFIGISKWLNTDKNSAVKIADQKNKVTLVTFWTYSSINSVRTFPYLTKWQKDYEDDGLKVIGIHTPEFAFEKVTGNIENAIKTHYLNFPVGQDNEYKTWTAYHNQFWPAVYLIDRDGNIVYTHYGEGSYEEIEKAVRMVLGLEGSYNTPPPADVNQASTPEIYLGLTKLKQLGNSEKPSTNEQIYAFPKKLGANKVALEGRWVFNQEAAIHTSGYARMKLNFDAAKVFLVAQSKNPTTIRIRIDGKLIKGVVVSNSDLYQLYDSLSGGEHTMEIEIPDSDFQAFTFTFG